MFTLYRIALAPARKPYRMAPPRPDFGSISETEGSCAEPAILKVDLHRSDRFLQLFAEVKVRERGLEPITHIQTYIPLPVREHRPAKLNLSFFPMEMVQKFSSITI